MAFLFVDNFLKISYFTRWGKLSGFTLLNCEGKNVSVENLQNSVRKNYNIISNFLCLIGYLAQIIFE